MIDYISRQAALDALGVTKNATKYGGDHSGYDTRMLYEIHDALTGIPAADVVPVMHGKWEDKEVIHKKCIEEWQSARCSACGKYHTTPYMYYFDDFKFCPNCGAKMDGGESDG